MKKILIIDDDARNIFALTATLKSKGFEIISAADAIQGIAFVNNTNNIGLILIDMMMPGMDGYEAIFQMSGIPEIQHIPVIAVTAQAMVGDRERCLKAGAVGYVSKPIDVDELTGLLKRYIL